MTNDQFTTYRLTITATCGANQIQIGEVQLLSMEPVDPTGIRLTPTFSQEDNLLPAADSLYYNLSGQRLSKPMRGINIIKGKKIVVKF